MSKVSIGTDPEAFLFDKTTNKYVPACGLIGGTKEKPLRYNKKLREGFTIQEDNVMVEFNIPPAFSASSWCEYLGQAISSVTEYLQSKGNYEMRFVSQNKFPNKVMQSEQAMQFGCSPDFDAYNNGAEYKGIDTAALKDSQGQWRLAGGHVHVGYDAAIPTYVAAAFADYYIGLPSVGYDAQERRRGLYGQPGRHRPTPYGIEYRTLSNYWLADFSLISAVGHSAMLLGNYLTNTPVSKIKAAYQKMPWGLVRDAISSQNLSLKSQVESYVSDEGFMSQITGDL